MVHRNAHLRAAARRAIIPAVSAVVIWLLAPTLALGQPDSQAQAAARQLAAEWELVGIIIVGPQHRRALLEHRTMRVQVIMTIGSVLSPGVTIEWIDEDWIAVEVHGTLVTLTLRQSVELPQARSPATP